MRTLERHFLQELGKTPKSWLSEQRQHQALGLLRNGSSVKETAAILGFKHATHFSRDFKMCWGHVPTTQNKSNQFEKTQVS
jgi:AraC-like DNA-binding protein